MKHRQRLVVSVGAIAFVAAGCGDDEPVESSPPAVTENSTGADGATTAPQTPGDAPNATVAPNLPPELAGEIGAIEVSGDPLPPLQPGTAIADDPALGITAPVVVGQDFGGSTVRVDPAADGPTMVVFVAHWCPHCNNEVPRINELRDAGSLPDDLNVVAVSTAVDPTRQHFPPSEWFEGLDWTYPVIADGVDMDAGQFVATSAYGVTGFPFVTLVDGDGKVVARWSGEHDTDELLELVTSNLPA